METRVLTRGMLVPGHTTASSWRVPTLVLWAISRLILFINVAVWHHPCDRVFWIYGHNTVALHLLPYRDYPIEYPPLATLLFMIPGAARDYLSYATGFALMMAVVDAATVLLVRYTAERFRLWADGWQAAFLYTGLSFATFALLSKFDLAPGALTLLAVLFLVEGRERAAWIALAGVILFKGYAVVLAPLFLLYRYRMRGAAGWWRGPLAGAAAALAVLGPFIALAGPRLVVGPLYHARRGVQIESIYASVALVAHVVFGLPVKVFPASPQVETTSRDIISSLNGPLLALFPVILGGGLAATYVVAWRRLRRDPSPECLLLLCMAAVMAFIVAFKALPLYYVLWIVPMAAIIIGRAGSQTARLGGALWLTLGIGGIVPPVYSDLIRVQPAAIVATAGRNLGLVAFLVLLVLRASRGRRSATGKR